MANYDKFLYKKYTKIPTVQQHKKVFRELPDHVEFAKKYMPVNNYLADVQLA